MTTDAVVIADKPDATQSLASTVVVSLQWSALACAEVPGPFQHQAQLLVQPMCFVYEVRESNVDFNYFGLGFFS